MGTTMSASRYGQRTDSLAPGWNLQVAVKEVVRLVNEPRTTVSRLAAAVARNGDLATSVLRKANSSAFGLSGRVKNLNSAVVVLGFDALRETLRNLLVSTAGRSVTQAVVQNQELWEHSTACAVAARLLAGQLDVCSPDDAYLAGMLHDVGVLFASDPAMQPRRSRNEDAVLAPRSRYPHAAIGADKAREWGVDEGIVEAIRFHHQPGLASRHVELTAVLHVAEHLCHNLNGASVSYEHVDRFEPAACVAIGLPRNISPDEVLSRVDGQSSGAEDVTNPFGVALHEAKQSVREVIDGLPEEQRIILALRYYEGLSLGEIAQLFGLPASSVEAQFSEAMATLKQVLRVHH
jgi:putative nucleotidyltransferase with HDIG domain